MPYNSRLIFIKRYINKSSLLPTSKLDTTIRAVINRFIKDRSTLSPLVIEYLNILRIIYFLKRLKYYKLDRFSDLSRKSNTP